MLFICIIYGYFYVIIIFVCVCSAWMRYHKHMKRKKTLLAKKMENSRLWHKQRVQRIHLQCWIVSFYDHRVQT